MDDESFVEIELPTIDPAAQEQAQQLNDAAMAICDKHPGEGSITALVMLRRALNLAPHQAETWSNLGLVLWRLGRIEEAGEALQRAVDLYPDRATFHGNLGVFCSAVDRARDASSHLLEAARLDPNNVTPLWDHALLYLRHGDWARGLKEYDIRRKHKGPKLYPEMPVPLWRGEDLNGKTLYVQGEQGIGDRFLFSRYLSWIKETWPDCKILVSLYDPMTNIFWEFRHLVEFLPQGVPYPKDLDYAAFLCSLPEMHGSTPDTVPPDPGFLRKRIDIARNDTKVNLPTPALPSLKVGICWTGNPEQIRNQDRSIPLDLLMPLQEDPRIALYSFQVGPGQKDIDRLHAHDLICDLSSSLEKEGWVGTGLAMMEMDLMLTVCTSIAHLAGALGVPTWTILCSDPYWPWGRQGDTTPWYPHMYLYRQTRLGDWKPVLSEVRSALSSLADEKLNPQCRTRPAFSLT